jgi:hypothetical protein
MIPSMNHEHDSGIHSDIQPDECISGITKCDRYNCKKDTITTISVSDFVNNVCLYHAVKNQFTNSERMKKEHDRRLQN